ncbi:hypothetical protein [Kutzneria sp. 744]|uniref:hypothetical protein n=1 Tax=Kutzneria sp. (strain 744) TaxID=345341 RepID=UPI0003EECEAC|nr:hypothetical protein [Kutzneria sp. 744]EWM12649.1 LigA protein [Kutzneria sp. 744]
MADQHRTAAAAILPDRDHLVAALVLLRSATPGEDITRTVLGLHAAVITPLLDPSAPAEEVNFLLRWAKIHGGAETLDEVAYSEAPEWAALPDEVRFDLVDLSERIDAVADAAGTLDVSGPLVLVQEPGGRFAALTVRTAQEHSWQVRRPADFGSTVDISLGRLLEDLPETLPSINPVDNGQSAPPLENLWWPPGIPLHTDIVALPMVLWRLGQIAGLGEPSALSAGRVTEDNQVFLDAASAEELGTLAKSLNRKVVVPTPTGWLLITPDGRSTRSREYPLTVDGAAAILWGERWQQWKRRRHGEELRKLEWYFVDWAVAPANQPLPDLRVTQNRQLAIHFLEKQVNQVAVLGGPRNSGKTTIVRLLAHELSNHRSPWRVVVVSTARRRLPDQAAMIVAGLHALRASAARAGQRRLLVFDGIRPSDFDNDTNIGDAMRTLARTMDTNVLTVVEHNENSPKEWQLDDVYVVTAPASEKARKRFVDDLRNADPALSSAADRAKAACRTTTDLRYLAELLTYGGDPRTRIAGRLAELSADVRASLTLAAAMSLIGGEVPARLLDTLDHADRPLFGVVSGQQKGFVSLSGYEDCLAIVDRQCDSVAPHPTAANRYRTAERNTLIAEQVEPMLCEAIVNHGDQVARLLSGARLFHHRLAKDLLDRVDQSLLDWADGARVTSVVEVLDLTELLSDQMKLALSRKLLVRLPRESPDWRPGQLLALLKVVQPLSESLPRALQEKFVAWLVDVVDVLILCVAGQPHERLALLSALERADSDKALELLVERVLDVLHGIRANRSEDYQLVRKVEEMRRRLEWKTSEDFSMLPIDQEAGVQALLNHVPHSDDGVNVLVESMMLRQRFEYVDWQERFEPFEVPLTAAMSFASAADLAKAINDLHTTMPMFSTWLLGHWGDFPEQCRTLLRKSSPTEAPALVNAVARSYALKIPRILYFANGRVDTFMVERFATEIKAKKDATGAGLLLLATSSADELFHTGLNVFSYDLAKAIGQDAVDYMLRHDPRTSTRYYLIKGVWDAGADYRDELVEQALDIVAEGVLRRRKHWAIELALMLTSDTELGGTALDGLRKRLSPADLLRSMCTAYTTYTRAMSHRLGRVLHPEVTSMYLTQWDKDSFVEGVATSSAVSSLTLCAEVSLTLTDANLPEAGRVVFEATGGVEHWVRRLALARRPGSLAQALRQLLAVDRVGAREVLDRLLAKPVTTPDDTSDLSMVAIRTRRAMLTGATMAAELIQAVETVRPGAGADVLAELADDDHAMYVFTSDLQQMQNPVAQSQAARTLVRSGVTSTTANAQWITSAYDARIQTVKYFASPRATTALLKMISAWDPQWGANAAREVSVGRVGSRIAFGRADDLASSVDLIRTLSALSYSDKAQRLLEALINTGLEWVVARLDLNTLCQLVEVARILDTEIAYQLLYAVRDRVEADVRTPIIANEGKVWRRVARGQSLLRDLGATPAPPIDPVIRPNAAYSPAVAWAAVSLGADAVWGDNALARARTETTGRLFPTAVDQACLLLATAEGWAPELRRVGRTWSVDGAPLWLLRLLYARAGQDAYVAAVLRGQDSLIEERIHKPTADSDWDAVQLRLILDVTAPATRRQLPPEAS